MTSDQEHILIVEWDVLIRQPLAQYLRKCGYKVLEAADDAEARSIITPGKYRIDIVLADIDENREKGFALAHWIRSNYLHIEVMLADTIEKATQKAGDICSEGPTVTKPYEHRLVLQRIKKSLAARERNRQ